jgi:hypothetical protein
VCVLFIWLTIQFSLCIINLIDQIITCSFGQQLMTLVATMPGGYRVCFALGITEMVIDKLFFLLIFTK